LNSSTDSTDSFRAPADCPKSSLESIVKAAIGAVFAPFTACRHRNTTRPYSNRQKCLDCGAGRIHVFTDSGISVGKWRKNINGLRELRSPLPRLSRPKQ
jgi:hypothetical protein